MFFVSYKIARYNRAPCKWGMECRHIKDSEHCRKYIHHPDNQQKHADRDPCKWGMECRHIKDSEHCQKYFHHPDSQQKSGHHTPHKRGS